MTKIVYAVMTGDEYYFSIESLHSTKEGAHRARVQYIEKLQEPYRIKSGKRAGQVPKCWNFDDAAWVTAYEVQA